MTFMEVCRGTKKWYIAGVQTVQAYNGVPRNYLYYETSVAAAEDPYSTRTILNEETTTTNE